MDNQKITELIVSQYKAALQMLRRVIEQTPEAEWNTAAYKNPNWQLAYHIVWGVKFYLAPNAESYAPWPNALEGAESLGGSEDWENSEVPVEGFHTREELLGFIEELENQLPKAVAALPFEGESGFEWYPYSRLELHINSIRHIQHHTAQLIERLKIQGISGFPWAADGNPPQQW